MPATPSRPTNDELPGMPAHGERDAADPVFEMAPGVQHQPGLTASASAISEDFGAQLHDAQERLLDLRQQQDLLERRRDELEELRQKQERLDYIKSVVETMQGAQSMQELKKLHDHAVRRLTARNDDTAIKRIAKELRDLTPKFSQESAA